MKLLSATILALFFSLNVAAQFGGQMSPPPPPPGGSELVGGDLIAMVVEEEICPGEFECRAVCPNLTESCILQPAGNNGNGALKVRDECKTYMNGSCKGVAFPIPIWSEILLLITMLFLMMRVNYKINIPFILSK